jgi:UDP-N-acetyl-D-mannosaminuronate dehydrogenase
MEGKNYMIKTVGILGLGEVGRAIKERAEKNFTVVARDLSLDEFPGKTIDILHVAIPYNDDFIAAVEKTINEVKPQLVIIDASVKPGTTRELYNRTKVTMVHAPIDGVHPNLAKYQTTFTKAIGAIDDKGFTMAREHWLALGAPEVVRFDSPEDSELAKLLSTTYYGWNIVFNKLVKRMCENTGTNFDQVYTAYNDIYNAGYAETLPHVRRPTLKYVPGQIGGHCVMPNIEILKTMFADPGLDLMAEFNESLKDEVKK